MNKGQKVTIDLQNAYDFDGLENITITGANTEMLTKEQQEVLYEYARYWEALTEADMETLDEMIADDSTFTHMSGKKQTKEEYLADVENGRLNYIAVEIQNPVVTINKNIASVSCTTVLTANAYGAKGAWPFTGRRMFTKQDGTWKVINQ